MKRALTMALIIALAGAGGLAADRTPPVDEDRIYREIAELQDRVGSLEPEAAEEAEKLLARGVAAHDRRDYEEALEWYGKALTIAPTWGIAHYETAFTLNALGRSEQALEAVVRAIALDPKVEIAYVLKGSIEDDLGHPELSIATYDRLLEIMPDNYLARLNKAITLMKSGSYEQAEAELRRAVESDPEHPSGYLRLAQLAQLRGFNYDEEEHLEHFLEIGPDDPRAVAARQRLEELRRHDIELDADAAYPDIAMALAMSRSLWRSTEHRKRFPDARGYRRTVEEDRAVLQEQLLGSWREKKAENPGASHAYYDFLLKIDDAGFFDEFIYTQGIEKLGQPARDWIEEHPERVEAFFAWARAEGLADASDDADAPEAVGGDGQDDDLGEDDGADNEAGASRSIGQRDLPGFVIAVVAESEVVYEIGAAEDGTSEFFEREAERWRRFRPSGDDRAECDFDVREAMETAYSDHVAPMRRWVRCFGPRDEQWSELGLVGRFGMRYRDLAPSVRGSIEPGDDGVVRVHYDVEGSTGWLSYLLFKAAWPREPALRQAADHDSPGPSLTEEVLAFTTAIGAYRNSLEPDQEEETPEVDPYLQEVASIDEAGLLRAFVAFEVLHKRYGVSLRRLPSDLANEIDRYLRTFVFRPVDRAGS